MKTKVAVIDDDKDILSAITEVLDMEGYEVRGTHDGNAVIKLVSEFRPDIIVLDLLLSGSDGSTICKQLKAMPDLHPIPVIMISAHPSAKAKAIDAGADAFIAKPFELTDLLAAIESRSRKQDQNPGK